VLDLGAGTGKLTRALVPRFARVVAVEPDDAMRAVLEQVVPEAEALAGAAEAIPVADGSVDGVFSGEAFHWFATREVLDEIARVLKPRGGFAFMWNVPVREVEPPVPEEVDRLLDEAFARGGAPGLPKVLSGEWRKPFEGSPFEELREAQVEREVAVDRDTLIASILSISSIAWQPDEYRRELGEQMRRLIPERTYRRFFRTDAYWTRLAE
jgi:ubiquinone/menaquinone biosynthesis C-methylase UbiE